MVNPKLYINGKLPASETERTLWEGCRKILSVRETRRVQYWMCEVQTCAF